MNALSENPLLFFVDKLADNSPNFADEGKIVELLDTGCDARTPGATLKRPEEPDTPIDSNESLRKDIPTVQNTLLDNSTAKKTVVGSSAPEDTKRNVSKSYTRKC